MLSSALVFAASAFTLVQGQFIGFTAIDDYSTSGCNQNSPPIMYRNYHGINSCHRGSPNLADRLYYGSTTCKGAVEGSFMLTSFNGTISDTTDATIVMRLFSDSVCASPTSVDTLSVKNGCIVSSLNFAYPIKIKWIPDRIQVQENGSRKIPFVECSSSSSSASTASTSTAATSTGSAASSVTGTTSSATGTATTISTSSTASKTGSIISSGSPVTGSMLGVAAVAIMCSIMY